MNINKNACTTPRGRATLVQRLIEEQWPVNAVARDIVKSCVWRIDQATIF